ncbi:MAG: GGDEF domain-containing protein, partial [Thiotrichales bacterium]|nr:GGDEF domain-containing protein [Thiotrichales bacterium]
RYGGEELLALLPGLDLKATRSVAERLRGAVEKLEITANDGTVLPSLTISAGIAEMRDGIDPVSLIADADSALYRAKNEGRNRVCD